MSDGPRDDRPPGEPPPGFRRRLPPPRRAGPAQWVGGLAVALIALFLAANHIFGWGWFGDGDVPAESVQTQIARDLSDQPGPPTVHCPGDLRGVVGATLTCTATTPTGDVPVHVAVTAVRGDDVEFSEQEG